MMKRLFFLALTLFFALVLTAQAKPQPPGELMKLFTGFIAGEEMVEESEWNEARDWTRQIESRYQTLRPQLSKDVPQALLERFDKSFNLLKSEIAANRHDAAHSAFSATHKAFIAILDSYDFKVLPLLFLMQNDLKEAEAALKSGDLEEMRDELNEAEYFYGQMTAVLLERGVTPAMIDELRNQIVRCRSQLDSGNRKGLAESFEMIQRLFAAQYAKASRL